MSKRQKLWAKAARAKIVAELGGCCDNCGDLVNLTLDCLRPRGKEHHKLDTSSRISFYRKQMSKDNLRVLCRSCNSSKSG
jgi:hypothetical protein